MPPGLTTRSWQPDLFLVCFLPLTLPAIDPGAHSTVIAFACPLEKSHRLHVSLLWITLAALQSLLRQCTPGPQPSQHPNVHTIPLWIFSPLNGVSPCLASLELRPTKGWWLPFLFFRYLIKEENTEGGYGAVWKSGRFLRIIYPHYSFWASEIKALTTWPVVHVPWSFSD